MEIIENAKSFCIPLAIVRTFRGLNIAAVSEFFMIFEIDWSVIDDFRSEFFFSPRAYWKIVTKIHDLSQKNFVPTGFV